MAVNIKKHDSKNKSKVISTRVDPQSLNFFTNFNDGRRVTEIDNFKVDEVKMSIRSAVNLFNSTFEIRQDLRMNGSVKVDIGDGKFIIIVQSLILADKPMVYSFPKFCAILAYRLTRAKYGEVYDWESNAYKSSGDKQVKKGFEENDVPIINRLALSIGLRDTSRLYTLYVQGVEFLFEAYPVEVLAICIWKAKNMEKIKLQGDKEICYKSLIAKIIKCSHRRKGDGGIDSVKSIIQSLDSRSVNSYIKELDGCAHRPGLNQNYIDIMEFLRGKFDDLD